MIILKGFNVNRKLTKNAFFLFINQINVLRLCLHEF